MPLAACFQDPVEHSSVVNGILFGAAAGLAIGAIIVFGVGTGGVGLLVGAALAGAAGGELIMSLSVGQETFAGEETGMLASGSPNVFIHHKAAVRAVEDIVDCKGTPPFFLPSHVLKRVAEGSETVSINSLPAARIGDKIECGAIIADTVTIEYVVIGGRTVQALEIEDEVPGWLRGLQIVIAVATWGPIVVGIGLIGGYLGETGLRYLAQKAGLGEDGQKIAGFVGGFLGSWAAGAGLGKPLANMAGKAVPGRLGGFLRGGVPGMNPFPGRGPASDAAAQKVIDAMAKAKVNPNKARIVDVFVNEETGKVTVAVSGKPAKAAKLAGKLKPHLPPEYDIVTKHDLALHEVKGYEHAECAEPKLHEAMRGQKGQRTTRGWGDPAKLDKYRVAPGSDYMKPCPKCQVNATRIAEPKITAPALPPLLCPILHDHDSAEEHAHP